VLPSDVLPRKTYAAPAIELGCAAYGAGDRSLRAVAWSLLGERTPAHTTLHAWTEGLGAYALGRQTGEVPGADPFSAVLAETRRRWPTVGAVVEQEISVDPRRYRSEARRERLAAMKRVLLVASATPAGGPDHSLSSWRRLALAPSFGLTSPLAFRTGLSCTSIEHGDRARTARSRRPDREGSSCQTRTRSPPGDMSRSHRSSIRPSTAPEDGA
jgi:hypothetical protein